jgi:hypothetical protein
MWNQNQIFFYHELETLFFGGAFPCSVQEVTWVLLLGIHVWDPLGYNRLEQQTRSVSTHSISLRFPFSKLLHLQLLRLQDIKFEA